MKVDVKETGEWKRELHVELSDEEVRAEMRTVIREHRKKTALPGFRKGKVPERIIEERFGEHLEEQLVNRLLPKAYRNALSESGLDPIRQGQIRDLKYTKGEPLSFVAELEVRPEIEIGDIGGFELEKRIFHVSEAEIDHTLDVLRDQHAEYEKVERASKTSDQLKVVLSEAGDEASTGEETEVILGTEGLLPAFEEALTGVEANTTHDIEITYPDDMPTEELRGMTRTFRVEVREIAEKKLPELDDKFAEKIGFEGVDDLRSRIQSRLEGEELQRADREVEARLIEQLLADHVFDAPEVMVESLLDNFTRDYNIPEEEQEEFRKEQLQGAQNVVRRMLILDAVARENEIEVSDDEVEASIRESIEDKREAAKALRKARETGSFDRQRHALRERKTMDFLLEKAEIEEVRMDRPSAPGSA